MKDTQKQPERAMVQEMAQASPYAGTASPQEFFEAIQDFQSRSDKETVALREVTTKILDQLEHE